MPAIVVVGGQWGDEGKGRIVDHLAQHSQVVVRYSGGNNAGHTVMNDLGEFRLHLVPCGIFYPGVQCVIGSGVVVDPEALIAEMGDLEERGVSMQGLAISDRAHLVLPYHRLVEGLQEEAWGERAIGTTRRGIGPAYEDKVGRLGLRMGDLLDQSTLRERLGFVLKEKNRLLERLYGARSLSFGELFQSCLAYGRTLAPHIQQTELLVQEAWARGETVLLEGAQGTLLDSDAGTYPYVTSSLPGAGGAAVGSGLGPTQIGQVVGVFKAYTTRVGAGPMPTELSDEMGEALRELGSEFGATTGRPRRCGWLDAVLGRYSARVNGLNAVALTRLDILDPFPQLSIAVAYRLRGAHRTWPPSSVADLALCEPIYEELGGWEEPIGHCRRFEELPAAAQRYVLRIEELLGCPIALISVGPRREELIVRRSLLPGGTTPPPLVH